jgi:hypothetical protein
VAALRLTLASSLSSLLLLAAPAAAANELDVTWNAPAGCPAYSDVESWLQAVVPPDAREELAELHVQVLISGRADTGYRATVLVSREGPRGERLPSEPRTVEGPACEEVARSVIVIVSVEMSDVMKAEAPSPRDVAPPAAPAEVQVGVQPVAAVSDRPEPAAPPPTAAQWLFNVAAGVGSGFAENPGVRVDAEALFALSRAIYLGPRLHALPGVTIQRKNELARLRFAAAGVQLCGLPTLSTLLQAGVCARVEAGLAWSQGAQAEDPSDSGAVAALGLSPTLSIGSNLRVLLQGDLELRLLRPRFEDDTGEVLAALPVVAGSGLVGLSLAVP